MSLMKKERGREYTQESRCSDWESENKQGVVDNEETLPGEKTAMPGEGRRRSNVFRKQPGVFKSRGHDGRTGKGTVEGWKGDLH